MASSGSPPPSPLLRSWTPPDPIPEPVDPVCRLCGKQCSASASIHIFSAEGKTRGLPEKVRLCLPVAIEEYDELSKVVCSECQEKLETVRGFFESVFSANQQLVLDHRQKRVDPHPLEPQDHINHYIRSFQPACLSTATTPAGYNIKIEPGNYLDVGLDEDGEDENVFKVPLAPGTNLPTAGGGTKPRPDKRKGGKRARLAAAAAAAAAANAKKVNPDGSPFDPFFDDPGLALEGGEASAVGGGKVVSDQVKAVPKTKAPKRAVPISLKCCADCGQMFPDHASNLAHWKERHPEKEVLYRCNEIDVNNQLNKCDFQSHDTEDMFRHRLGHRPKVLQPIEDKKEKLVDCKICLKPFTPSFLINRHMGAHADLKDNPCGLCGKTFPSAPEELKAHLKLHDEEDVKYAHCCELCGKRFTQRANLDAHLRIHSGYKPHACDFCGKCFSQKGNMEEHRRVHTGEKPFQCEMCGSSFARRSEMVLHNRIAHTGERPFQCAYCPKAFQRRDLMRKHERIHTDTRPYSCQYCAKAFTQRDKMVVHTRLHTGERPYVCDVCGKGFCESGNLKKHMRVHGKEPPSVMHQNNKGKPAPNPNGQFSGKHIPPGSSGGNSLPPPQLHNDSSNHQLQQQQQHSQPDLTNQVPHQQQHLQQQQPFQQQVQQPHPDFGNQLHEDQVMMKTEQQQHPMTPHGDEGGEAVAASPGLPTVASAAAAAAAVAAALRTHPEMHQNAAHMAHGSNMPVQVKIEQQSHQYSSFTMAAAAAARAAAMHNHAEAAAAANNSHISNGGSRTSTSTPASHLHPDIDTQSEAGSERSVTSPFVAPGGGGGSGGNQHGHYQSHAHQTHLPYHMSHHPLIQHLNEIRGMQDVWYSAANQHHAAAAHGHDAAATGGAGGHWDRGSSGLVWG